MKWVQCTMVLIAQLVTCSSVTVVSTHTPSYRTTILKQQALSMGFNFVQLPFTLNSLKEFLSDNADQQIILIETDNILLNSDKLYFQKGSLITAGSQSCEGGGCHAHSASQGKRSNPYSPDSSVVLGYGSDILKSISSVQDDIALNLQDVLSETYFNTDTRVTDMDSNMILDVERYYKEVELRFEDDNNSLYVYGIKPAIIMSSNSGDKFFNEISRYVGNSVTRTICNNCQQTQWESDNQPTIFIAVHATTHTHFVSNLLDSLVRMEYDLMRVEVVVLSLIDNPDLNTWDPTVFGKFTLLTEDFDDEDHDSRYFFLELFTASTAAYYVYIDTSVHVYPNTIPDLIRYNKPLIAPLLKLRNGTAWANFWGSYTTQWGYERSSDYANIFTETITGIFPVPCVRYMYIVQRDVALDLYRYDVYDNHVLPDVSFCSTLTEKQIPMYLANMEPYGWLKTASLPHNPDLPLSGEYMQDWEAKYLISNLHDLEPRQTWSSTFTTVCRHIYRRQVFSGRFGDDLIKEMERVGAWKIRAYQRPSIDITNTPLNDTLAPLIHDLTKDLIPDLFPGYTPTDILYDAFVIKVSPEKQKDNRQLNKHHAAYHVLVPLNNHQSTPGLAGGGYDFARQNCTIMDYKSGEMYVFPGFITHYKADIVPDNGNHYYLELSFDHPR